MTSPCLVTLDKEGSGSEKGVTFSRTSKSLPDDQVDGLVHSAHVVGTEKPNAVNQPSCLCVERVGLIGIFSPEQEGRVDFERRAQSGNCFERRLSRPAFKPTNHVDAHRDGLGQCLLRHSARFAGFLQPPSEDVSQLGF